MVTKNNIFNATLVRQRQRQSQFQLVGFFAEATHVPISIAVQKPTALSNQYLDCLHNQHMNRKGNCIRKNTHLRKTTCMVMMLVFMADTLTVVLATLVFVWVGGMKRADIGEDLFNPPTISADDHEGGGLLALDGHAVRDNVFGLV